MPFLYLHGPREGQTIKIRGVQFIAGVAEYPTFPKSLEKFYGVKDTPPKGFEKIKQPKGQEIKFGAKELDQKELAKSIQELAKDVQESDVSVNNEQEDKEKEQKELRELIESKKKDLSEDKLKTFDDFNNWGKWKSYVKKTTGLNPKNKVLADQIMSDYASKNNLEYGEE
jgi:hypothetical protein